MSNLTDIILENPSDEHIKALLSNLAYENLSTGFNFSNLDSSFSIAEKNYLNENFEILSVSDSNESGFQGCFLKNTKTNEIIFAIRGTETDKLEDVDDGLDIINSGMAYKQFIDAYNYYIKTVTATGDTGKLLKYGNQQPAEGIAYIDTGDGHYIYFEDFTGTGNGYSNVSITGHSLGGHLAALLGVVTGNEATIFNAPGYKDQPKLDFSYVSEDGVIENTISMISGIISKLFEKNINSQGNITHIYNDNCQEWIANYGTKWKNNTPIYCLQKGSSVHAIDEICTAYYAYETIKNIANGAESFHNNSTITSFNETFENVYKAYCLQFNLPYQTLDYSNYQFIQTLVSSIQIWVANKNDGAIKVDSFNHSTSLPITGTDGADIIYTGGGNDTVNSGNGNDVVYGIDLDGDMDASAGTTKVINLGAGNDTYHGSNAKDIVSTTGENTDNDTNYIYLGAGADIFTGGAGADIVDAGILEKETGIEKQADLGAGNDVYLGGLANDKVNGGSGNNHILLGGGSDEYIGGDDIDIVDGGSGSLKVLNGVSGISGKENMTRDITSDKAGDINIINLGGGDDIYYGGKGQDIVDGGSGDDRIYAGDGNNVIMGGSGNDTIEVGRGDNEIHAGTGGDTIKTGVGNNHIYLGNDDQQDIVFVYNIGGYTDHIYEFSSNDYIKLSCDVSSVNYIDNDMIWTLENGAKVHFHNFSVGSEENQTALEYTSTMDISNADQLIQAMNSFSLSNSASADTLSDPTQDVSEMYSLAASELNTKAA